jgi:heterogeneous nuclear rnp K-like protein 2
MPDADTNRKRSRSPSDGDQKQYKRANTGAAPSDAAPTNSSSPAERNMTSDDGAKSFPGGDDNAASSPGSNPSDKQKDDSNKSNTDSGDAKATSSPIEAAATASAVPPSANIHMRCLIVTQDASIIIGKGGSHVNEIREKSGARVMVSESIPGNPERILNVSGPLDAVSKVSHLNVCSLCCLSSIGLWSHRAENQ